MSVIVDKAVAETLAGHFVPDQLAALHLSDGREKRADFLLELWRNLTQLSQAGTNFQLVEVKSL